MKGFSSLEKNLRFSLIKSLQNIYFLKTAVNEILERRKSILYLEVVETHGKGKQRIENLVTWLHPKTAKILQREK